MTIFVFVMIINYLLKYFIFLTFYNGNECFLINLFQEMSHVQCFSMNLLHMAVCPLDNKVIGCGDDNK